MNNIKNKLLILLSVVFIPTSTVRADDRNSADLYMNMLSVPMSVLINSYIPVPVLETLNRSQAMKSFLISGGIALAVNALNARLLCRSAGHCESNNNGYRTVATAITTIGNLAQLGCLGHVWYQRYKNTMEHKQQETRLLALMAKEERSHEEAQEVNTLIKRHIITK